MLFYIIGGAPQAVPGTACVEANRTACTEVYCSSERLNRVFEVIGFVYPNYCYPSRKQGKKRKTATSVTSSALK
jgi:predicted nucleic acid-binding Zn ribbon protein